MPNSPSNVDLSKSPIDSTTRGVVPTDASQLIKDHAPTVPTETRDHIDGALPLMREQLAESATRHPAIAADVPHITVQFESATDRPHERPHERHSPVVRLPPEILAYIFELYVVRLSELMTPDGVPSQGPSCLTQVCTLWRTVAESDPHLWTSIHFYFPETQQNRERDVPSVEPVLDQHLARSGVLPISLAFSDHRMYHPTTEDLIALLVDRLRTHAQRWKRVTLHLSCLYFSLLFEFTPCDLASLEHLSISGDVLGPERVTLSLNLESATKLKSFAYSGPGYMANDGIRLGWDSLEQVSLEFVPHNGPSFTLSRQFRNLAQCHNITTCSLGIDRTPSYLSGGQTITLPRLHTLRVRRLSPYAQAHRAIDPLTLPQLRTLEIDASILVGWNRRWHSRTFSNLLARSRCTLVHLSIQDVDFPNNELLRCLEHSPTLTSLRFIPCPRSQNISHVIREMDVSHLPPDGHILEGHVANAGPLVPQLREITLASSVEGYLGPVLTMLRSRVGARARGAGVATLRRAEVVFFDLWHDTDANRVRGEGHLESVVSFRADLARWASASANEGMEDEEALEASVVLDSPYLPEYIDVQ